MKKESKYMLQNKINEWRSFLVEEKAIDEADADELEDHLRNHISQLLEAGLEADEAFLIGVKRLGQRDSLSSEFAREHSERLWKRIVPAEDPDDRSLQIREAKVVLIFALLAALTIKIPELFGFKFGGTDAEQLFYARNFSLFTLPYLAGYFAWKRELNHLDSFKLSIPFFLSALIINLFPFTVGGHTELLSIMHLPIVLWLVVGLGYTGGKWQSHSQRMNFIRFSGEWFIYFVLIALGGGVFMLSTMFIFTAIGLDPEWLITMWIIPCGVMGAVIVAAWLVETKQSVVENMAPVLTHLFSPLFTLLLVVFLFTSVWTGSGINVEREVLIGFDLLLVVVVALLLYAISARDPQAEPGIFDILQLILVISALLVDAMALWAILLRISAFGFSPNRIAALGENLILVVNLGWSAVLYAKFLLGRSGIGSLERWQTNYLPVYLFWALLVVVIFPLVFRFQ